MRGRERKRERERGRGRMAKGRKLDAEGQQIGIRSSRSSEGA